jgi:phosphoglucomutase
MDPSSSYAMRPLVALKDRFDVAFACDADHDRHGVVTRGAGLLPPNHYLVACIRYLFDHRPQWSPQTGIGKTAVSSSLIDRVTAALRRPLVEVPVGFKWFVDGLLAGTLGFVGEESAGATFLRRDGSVWTTDKDGIVVALLAAEIMAKTGRDPGEIYAAITREHGDPVYERIDAPANQEARTALARVSRENLRTDRLAGEPIVEVLAAAPGNGEPLGGIKVIAASGWFAARPSGTEELYKIYAESFRGIDHLHQIQDDARALVSSLLVDRQPSG